MGIWEVIIKVKIINSRKGKSLSIGINIPDIDHKNTIKDAIIDLES
jgi:hypothetical protein